MEDVKRFDYPTAKHLTLVVRDRKMDRRGVAGVPGFHFQERSPKANFPLAVPHPENSACFTPHTRESTIA
jgi:hypothetical protein